MNMWLLSDLPYNADPSLTSEQGREQRHTQEQEWEQERDGERAGTVNANAIVRVNGSASQTEYMSSNTSKDGSKSGVLNRESMRFGHACYGL